MYEFQLRRHFLEWPLNRIVEGSLQFCKKLAKRLVSKQQIPHAVDLKLKPAVVCKPHVRSQVLHVFQRGISLRWQLRRRSLQKRDHVRTLCAHIRGHKNVGIKFRQEVVINFHAVVMHVEMTKLVKGDVLYKELRIIREDGAIGIVFETSRHEQTC